MKPGVNLSESLPPAKSIPDLPSVVAQVDWQNLPWAKDVALASYNIALLLWTIREKIAFSAYYSRLLLVDPRTFRALNDNPKRTGFVAATNELIALSEQMSIPNFMSSVRNLTQGMEVFILPKNFGVEVRGTLPFLRDGISGVNILDCVRIGKTGPLQAPFIQILDFGDLCQTSMVSDLGALKAGIGNQATGFQASLAYMDAFGLWTVASLLTGDNPAYPPAETIGDTMSDVLSDPNLGKAIDEIAASDPGKGKDLKDGLANMQKIWKGKSSILKWVAIGAGVVAVVAGVWVISGLSSAPSEPRGEDVWSRDAHEDL